jgi:transcription antitermination factor NusG
VRWYALRVQPQREFAADRILRDDGFENVFVPVKHILAKPHRGQGRQLLARPVFVGYVFIGFDPGAIPWGQVCRFEQLVIGVLGWDGEPLAFTDLDMVKHVFPLHQRPIPYLRGHHPTRKKTRSNAARVITGPYEGRAVRTVGLTGREPDALYELFQEATQRRAA